MSPKYIKRGLTIQAQSTGGNRLRLLTSSSLNRGSWQHKYPRSIPGQNPLISTPRLPRRCGDSVELDSLAQPKTFRESQACIWTSQAVGRNGDWARAGWRIYLLPVGKIRGDICDPWDICGWTWIYYGLAGFHGWEFKPIEGCMYRLHPALGVLD